MGRDKLTGLNARGMWALFSHFATGESWPLGSQPDDQTPPYPGL